MTRTVTSKQLGIATAAVALVLVAIWYLALLSPQTHKLAVTRQENIAAQNQISDLNQQIQQLTALEKEIPADQAKLNHYKQAIPSDPALSSAIRSIQAAATDTGVEMSSLNPTVPTNASAPSAAGGVAGATTIPVTISAAGTYSQVMAFLRALDAMPRTVIVQSFDLGGTAEKLTASIAADIYFSPAGGSSASTSGSATSTNP